MQKHMEVWDSENPNPRGFHREEAIDSRMRIKKGIACDSLCCIAATR